VSTDDDEKLAPGRIVAAIIFAVFAVAFVVIAGVYMVTPDSSLPGFMGYAQSSAHHTVRGVMSFVIGLAFALAAWFALRYRSLALEEAREADRAAALAEAGQAAAPAKTAPAEAVRANAAPAKAVRADTASADTVSADSRQADSGQATTAGQTAEA
jgi:hypothetical protein